MRLVPWLPWRAATTPDRVALSWRGDTLAWSSLASRARSAGRALAAAGVLPGERVALLVGNEPAFPILLHALWRVGAVPVPLNVRLRAEELAFPLADAGVRTLLASEGLRDLAGDATQRVAKIRLLGSETLAAQPGAACDEGTEDDAVPARIDSEDDAVIVYTSGTSGRPRGVRLTHGNLLWSASASAMHLGATPDDRWLATMPLFHVGGLSILVRSVLFGSAVHLQERFDADAVDRALDDEAITMLSLVPTMLQRLLDARGARRAPGSLRCVLVGGGPTPPTLITRARALGFPIATSYGLTEAASQVTTTPPGEAGATELTAGPALFGTELRIDASDPLGAGEIWVRGPTLMRGYLGDDIGPARDDPEHWHRTGDIGRLDAAGRLVVLDRRSDLVVTGGENVMPAEVEAVLLAHPDVDDAGVVGVPDTELGQRVAAVVVPRRGASTPADELHRHCRARLAGYKIPRLWYAADALPRTAAGKLQRGVLAASVRAGAVSTLGRS